MIEGKKISQLVETTKLNDACCFPVLSAGATRRITFSALVNNIVNALPESIDEQEIKEIRQKLNKHESEINELIIKGESIDEALNQIIFKVDGQDRTILEYTSVVQELKSVYEQATISGGVVDSSLNPDSINPVQNQVLAKLIPAEASVENKLADKASVNKKLDKTTTTSNAGKAVVVDENGNLVFGAAGVQVSHAEGNAIEEKQDGIYVETVNVSEEEGNALEKKTDGLYVSQVGGSSPIGTIIAYAGENIPAGFLLCDGRELLISDYQKLYEVIGQLPACQSENEGYFKLFDLRGKFTQGANNNLGENIAAGLPNITGTLGAMQSGTFNGAFSRENYVNDWANGNKNYHYNVSFDAADGETDTNGNLKTDESTKVFGKSNTVQPPAITVNFIIKATSTDDAIDNIIDDNTKDVGHAWSGAKVAEEIENITTYSTEEKVIGKWIDGKPLYQKTFYIESGLSNGMTIATIPNIKIRKMCGTSKYRNGDYYPFPFTNAPYSECWVRYAPNGNITLVLSDSFSDLSFTIEYTKTTD